MGGSDWQATVAWRGEAYVGWQHQPNGLSIQAVMERAIGDFCGTGPIRVMASGRTDSGVHALAQVISFRTPEPRTHRQLVEGINQHLPDDISVLTVAPAPPGFCPRSWSRRKLYRYRILNRSARCPFRLGLTWHIRRDLDADAMHRAAQLLVGRHDFTSFRAARCGAASPVRVIESAAVSRAEDEEIQLEFVGNGFLRHQVRIMTGTLVDVGIGTRSVDSFAEVLAAADRTTAGRTAPGCGLTLVRVELSEGP